MSSNTTDEYWEWTPGRTQGLGTAVSLAQDWMNVKTIGGSRFGMPVSRGQDYEVPFRAGKSWRSKFPDSRTITLMCWTAGIAQDGSYPDDQITQWNLNWQKIRQAFYCRGAQGSLQGKLTRRWNVAYQGGGTGIVQASAMAEAAGDFAPSMTGRSRSDFTADLLLADPYFYGATTRTATLAYGVPQDITADGEGVVGEGWPSLVNSFTIVLNGPLTSPSVVNSTEGVAVAFNGTISGGHYVTLDVLRSSAVTDLGVNVAGYVSHYGARMWCALTGGENPHNTLTLSSVDGTDTGTAVLSWNDCYI